MNRLTDFASYICMFRYGLYDIEDTSDEECFIWINTLVGVSIVDFVNVFPLEKTYDSTGDSKDYFYSKRALDTMLSSGKTHFESLDDIIDFFFEVQIENRYVEHLFIQAFSYMIHTAGYDIYDILSNILYPKYNNHKSTPHYLRIVK